MSRELRPSARPANTSVSVRFTCDATIVRRSLLPESRRSPASDLSSSDFLVLAAAFFFCTAIGPFFVFPSYTPRMVLLLLALLPGSSHSSVRTARDRAAMAACALAVWIVVAAFFVGSAPARTRGCIRPRSSALIAIGALGLWALGRELSESAGSPGAGAADRLLLSAARGTAPDPAEHRHGCVLPTADRASGLTTNPVYFGSLMGGAASRRDSMRDIVTVPR